MRGIWHIGGAHETQQSNGTFTRTLTACEQAVDPKIRATVRSARNRKMYTNLYLNRLEQAEATAKEAHTKGLEATSQLGMVR